MRYAITGASRELQPREANIVKLVIASLTDCVELTTGAAHGVDTEAYLAGIEYQKSAKHRVCIPAAPFNPDILTTAAWRDNIVEHCQRGLSNADSYMMRNARLILYADKLIAFPETADEQIRSGTWSTIRRARRAGIDVEIHPLNGRAPNRQARRRAKRRA